MTFAEVIRPFKTADLARRTDSHADTVRAWKRGEAFPTEAGRILAIAEFVRIDAAALLAMIANDSKQRTAATDSVRPGAAA